MKAIIKTKPSDSVAKSPLPPPDHSDIALYALHIWEEEGRPEGRALDHWLLAESRLKAMANLVPRRAPQLPPPRGGSKTTREPRHARLAA